MTTYAYLRVSTDGKGQTTENQKKLITDGGFSVDVWVHEAGVSGSIPALKRPEFAILMSTALPGDTVICTMIDRLGRNASDILHTVEEFKRLGIKLKIMQFDGVDITSTMGKMVLTLTAAFAEMEKNLTVERTIAGLERTVAQGTKLGRPLRINPDSMDLMLSKRAEGQSLWEIATKHHMPLNTVAVNLKKWKGKAEEYRKLYNKQHLQHRDNKAT